jgi:hypothetical protein
MPLAEAGEVGRRRIRARRGRVAVAAVALLVVGFLVPMPAAVPTGPLPFNPAASAPPRVTEHVILVSLDGLRPDAIDAFGATTLQRLIREGRHSLEATTVLPSNTIPSHTSLVTGVEPAVHGVAWNDRASVLFSLLTLTDRRRRAPTIFQFVGAAGLSSAMIAGKSQLR